MLFYSFKFSIFFIVIFSIYWSVRVKAIRNILLLSASYYFYISWNSYYALLIVISTIVDYICGLNIAFSHEGKYKKIWLALSIFINVGILSLLKYFKFFTKSFVVLLNSWGFQVSGFFADIILPIGISFYTFKTMTYTIDIYRGTMKPTSNFIDYALYVAFFPQLLAGPISQAKNLLPQIYRQKEFSLNKISLGLGIFFLGLVKKVFLSDLLNLMHVDVVFSNIDKFGAIDKMLAIYAYAIQIYADFSGYSDMAVGLALMFGFKIENNFNYPYVASNIREFWRRWHISLSTWFWDYFYKPLGGSRCSTFQKHRNIILTMLTCGMWHGASIHFMLWGVYHGTLISINHCMKDFEVKIGINKFLKVFVTFNLVCLGWILFKVTSTRQALGIILNIFNPGQYNFPIMTSAFTMVIIFISLAYHFLSNAYPIRRKVLNVHLKYNIFSSGFVIASIVLIAIFAKDMANTFIYFQF